MQLVAMFMVGEMVCSTADGDGDVEIEIGTDREGRGSFLGRPGKHVALFS